MNRKERAINLGLKINSLKGNLSVAKSVISELESEIKNSVLDSSDRENLLILYRKVVAELDSFVSPSVEERKRINQLIEDALVLLNRSNNYVEADKVEGSIKNIDEQLKANKILDKEHKTALISKVTRLKETQRVKVGNFLKRNFKELFREIERECNCENPFHVSVLIKKYNDIVKTTPLFADDRHELQGKLDTFWQKSAAEIKDIKKKMVK